METIYVVRKQILNPIMTEDHSSIIELCKKGQIKYDSEYLEISIVTEDGTVIKNKIYLGEPIE